MKTRTRTAFWASQSSFRDYVMESSKAWLFKPSL